MSNLITQNVHGYCDIHVKRLDKENTGPERFKGFGVLKTLFNIDPDGVTFSIDVGFITSAALFIFVLTRMHKLNDVISKQGERIAKIEGMLTAESPKDK